MNREIKRYENSDFMYPHNDSLNTMGVYAEKGDGEMCGALLNTGSIPQRLEKMIPDSRTRTAG